MLHRRKPGVLEEVRSDRGRCWCCASQSHTATDGSDVHVQDCACQRLHACRGTYVGTSSCAAGADDACSSGNCTYARARNNGEGIGEGDFQRTAAAPVPDACGCLQTASSSRLPSPSPSLSPSPSPSPSPSLSRSALRRRRGRCSGVPYGCSGGCCCACSRNSHGGNSMAAAAVAAALLMLSLMMGGWMSKLPTTHAQELDATAESPTSPPPSPGLFIAEFPVSGGFVALQQEDVVASQGFFMSLTLGTPPQTLDLRIDTTATVPWLQCNCQQCGPSQELNQFTVFLSDSIDLPKCGTEDCSILSLSGVPFGCVNASASGTQTTYPDITATSLPPTNPYCAYSMKETIPLTTATTVAAAATSSGSSSSISNWAQVEVYASSEGSVVFDVATVRLPNGDTVRPIIGVGCGGYQTGAWTNAQQVPFGVAALAPTVISLVHQLTGAGLADDYGGSTSFLGRPSLLLCLRTGDEVVQTGSRLWIGAPEFLPSVAKRSAKLMERYPARSYVINPVGMSVGAQRLPMPPAVLPRYNATSRTGGMLVNTSEAALLLPAAAAALVLNAVQAQHRGLNQLVPELANLVALEGCLCFDVTPYVKNNGSVYSRFANITIHFGKGDGDDLVVPPQAYLYYTQADIPFACVMVRSAPEWSTHSTLGYMWMRGRLYHLDAKTGIMSWAEADCPKADINKIVDTTVVFPPPPPPSPPLVSATTNAAATSNMGTRHAWAHALFGLALAAVHVAAGAWHHRL